MNSIIIYTDVDSPKLDYVFDYVFVEQMGVAWERVESQAKFAKGGVKLNYSSQKNDNTINVYHSGYFEKFSFENIPDIKDSFLENQSSFDVFSAVFYLLARVEEYNCNERDTHGRYPSRLSVLSKNKLLGSPVVDIWVQELSQLIKSKFDSVEIGTQHYSALSTIDVDHFFAYKKKPLSIQLGSTFRDILSLKWGRILDRLSPQDPYDKIDEMLEIHKSHGVKPLVFILTSERSNYDKNLSPKHPDFKSKVAELNHNVELGIHPSYYSGENSTLTQEIQSLSSLTQKPITKSRHHFLRLSLPDTYASLINNGITDDYTMGYPDQLGFRAGTSKGFLWYDLDNDVKTNLRVHPFCVMDVTLKKYLNLDPQQAWKEVNKLMVQIRVVGGEFSIIWHNSSFYEREGWQGWKKLYEDIIRAAFS